MKIAVIIGSSRPDSNSEMLADVVTKGIEHKRVHLRDLFIQPIEDKRHTNEGFGQVKDDYDQIIQLFMENDLVIFATPIYWYSMSGIMKNMIDRLSHAIRDERFPEFKERLKSVETIVLAVGGDDPKIKGLPLIQQFQYSFDFLSMNFTNYIIGEANRPGDILKDEQALVQANILNEKLKKRIDKI